MSTEKDLDKQQRDSLDEALLKFLQREPATIWSVNAYAELHSQGEIWESLKRLRKAGLVAEIYNAKHGSMWAALWKS